MLMELLTLIVAWFTFALLIAEILVGGQKPTLLFGSIILTVLLIGCRADAATSDFIQTDDLGYECVSEDQLESFWIAGDTGKDPMRAPPICIVDPCTETASQDDMAWLWGRALELPEYIDYRKRLSGLCGTPSYWEERGITEAQLLCFFGCYGETPIGFGSVDTTTPASVPLSPSWLFLFLAITFLVIQRKPKNGI